MPPVFASVPKTIVARAPPEPAPVAWATSPVPGTAWHSLQASARGAPARAGEVRRVGADGGRGGGGRAGGVGGAGVEAGSRRRRRWPRRAVWVRSPWQSVQPERVRFTVPSTWVAATTVERGVAGAVAGRAGGVGRVVARRGERRRRAVAGGAGERRRGLPGGRRARAGAVRRSCRGSRCWSRCPPLRRRSRVTPPVLERLARATVPAVATPVLWICDAGNGVAGVAQHRTRTGAEDVGGMHADAVRGGGIREAVGVGGAGARRGGDDVRVLQTGGDERRIAVAGRAGERGRVDGAVHVQAAGDEHRARGVHRAAVAGDAGGERRRRCGGWPCPEATCGSCRSRRPRRSRTRWRRSLASS